MASGRPKRNRAAPKVFIAGPASGKVADPAQEELLAAQRATAERAAQLTATAEITTPTASSTAPAEQAAPLPDQAEEVDMEENAREAEEHTDDAEELADQAEENAQEPQQSPEPLVVEEAEPTAPLSARGTKRPRVDDGELSSGGETPPPDAGTAADLELLNGSDPAMAYCAELIQRGKKIVILTGAGISKASGIATYRGEADSVWENTLVQWGQRKTFLQSPRKWWDSFWLPKHWLAHVETERRPNAAHYALSKVAADAPAVKLLTQNVDGLHLKSGMPPAQHVEAHGRLGLHKCISEGCPYASKESIANLEVEICEGPTAANCPAVAAAAGGQAADWECKLCVPGSEKPAGHAGPHLRIQRTLSAGDGKKLGALPCCPACKKPALPQTLLFDEDYDSHSFYQWAKTQEWLEEADGFIFVGTSFSVNLTKEALDIAGKKQLPVFDFNVASSGGTKTTRQGQRIKSLYMVVGKAEETLPKLSELVGAHARLDAIGALPRFVAGEGAGAVWPPSPSLGSVNREWTPSDHARLTVLGDNDEPWCDVALELGRTEDAVRGEWDKIVAGVIPAWSQGEDELLRSLVAKYGAGSWKSKAKALSKPNHRRLDCAVEARWVNVLQHGGGSGRKRARVANTKYTAEAPQERAAAAAASARSAQHSAAKQAATAPARVKPARVKPGSCDECPYCVPGSGKPAGHRGRHATVPKLPVPTAASCVEVPQSRELTMAL